MFRFLCVAATAWYAVASQTLVMVCGDDNDILRLLSSQVQPFDVSVVSSIDSAIQTAVPGDGIMIMAEAYPMAGTNVTVAQFSALAASNLSGVFIEMPQTLPGDEAVYTPGVAEYFHRIVMYSDAASSWGLNAMDLMQAQGAYFLDYPVVYAASASAGYGHVAGTYNATFGLPPFNELNAVLFSASLDPQQSINGAPAPNATFAATKLSAPVRSRYTPQGRWHSLWNYIVASVMSLPDSYTGVPDWDEVVRPAHRVADSGSLSVTDMVTAVSRAASWMAESSGLLVIGDNATCPAPYAGPDAGVVACMLEGFQSKMSWNGSQALAGDVRMDCTAETAMALALRRLVVNGTSTDDPAPSIDYDMLATALLNFTWIYSDAAQFAVSDPAFGLVRWGLAPADWAICTYGDDNARVLLSSMLAASALRNMPSFSKDTLAFDRAALISLLANLRISSVTGFRPGRINYADIEASGWKAYAGSGDVYANTSNPQPHYQAQMWASFLLAWARTLYEPFYARAAAGIASTMDAGYPASWRWTEYLSEERGRLLLAVAWLVRADISRGARIPEHDAWLELLTNDLVATQDSESGGITERLGTPSLCDACPPTSNAGYGGGEAPLIQTDADASTTDQLYGNNFYLVSLIEAASALPQGSTAAVNASFAAWRLAQYLTAIQAHSTSFPDVSGAWLRAFDLRFETFWGSASDSGWGPWSVESGWSATWSSVGLTMAALNTTLWDWQAAAGSGMTPALLAEVCPLVFTPQQCAN